MSGLLSPAFHYIDCFTVIGLSKHYVLPCLEFSGETVLGQPKTRKLWRKYYVQIVSGLQSVDYGGRLKKLGMIPFDE